MIGIASKFTHIFFCHFQLIRSVINWIQKLCNKIFSEFVIQDLSLRVKIILQFVHDPTTKPKDVAIPFYFMIMKEVKIWWKTCLFPFSSYIPMHNFFQSRKCPNGSPYASPSTDWNRFLLTLVFHSFFVDSDFSSWNMKASLKPYRLSNANLLHTISSLVSSMISLLQMGMPILLSQFSRPHIIFFKTPWFMKSHRQFPIHRIRFLVKSLIHRFYRAGIGRIHFIIM